jgi:hypothetical protein
MVKGVWIYDTARKLKAPKKPKQCFTPDPALCERMNVVITRNSPIRQMIFFMELIQKVLNHGNSDPQTYVALCSFLNRGWRVSLKEVDGDYHLNPYIPDANDEFKTLIDSGDLILVTDVQLVLRMKQLIKNKSLRNIFIKSTTTI